MNIQQQLAEARLALNASIKALQSHGRQAITWQLYKADAERVQQLEREAAGKP